MKKRRIVALCIFSFLFLMAFSSTVSAKGSLRKVNTTWEGSMGNSLILSYYSLGLIGDLYRLKVYPQAKAHRYLRMVHQLLREDILFAKSLKLRGARKTHAFFRKLRATQHLLYIAANSLQLAILKKNSKKMKEFLTYRNAVAQDIGKVMSDPSISKTRKYRGGWKTSTQALGHFLGIEVSYGFLLNGMIADAYFQRAINKQQLDYYLKVVMKIFHVSALNLKSAWKLLRPSDQSYVKEVYFTLRILYLQSMMLKKFAVTRNRIYLAKYLQQRRAAWAKLAPLAR